ncbi:MAG: hypothetical protein QNJ54_23710 [Prochloraceae cyanobacterium]|nr:hypothetical protein [Prochloraceae cyanobacterium]
MKSLFKSSLVACLFLGATALSANASSFFLKTRSGYYLNAYDSIGNVTAIPKGNTIRLEASDEIFRLVDLNGGVLKDGDRICIKTRRGYYLNAYDSTGNVTAIPRGNCSDINRSDEIFRIVKVNGSGTISSGDRICIKTRRGYYLNAYDSKGNVTAIPRGNCSDINRSDEIFRIYFK